MCGEERSIPISRMQGTAGAEPGKADWSQAVQDLERLSLVFKELQGRQEIIFTSSTPSPLGFPSRRKDDGSPCFALLQLLLLDLKFLMVLLSGARSHIRTVYVVKCRMVKGACLSFVGREKGTVEGGCRLEVSGQPMGRATTGTFLGNWF